MNSSVLERVADLPAAERTSFLERLDAEGQLEEFLRDWRVVGRPNQIAPPGDWLTWLLKAGRGFGKTRSGSEWVHERAREEPGRWMAFVAKNPADARDYMIEGPGGVQKNAPTWCREAEGGPWPKYEPSLRRITWPNDTWATIYSDEKPDQLRGFSGDTAWIDELGKFKHGRLCWDNLQFGMREASSDQPRVLITTTPRPMQILRDIENERWTVTVQGSSYENRSNLDPRWFSRTLAAYEGTRLGRQEIYGETLKDVEGRVYGSFLDEPYPIGNVDDSVRDIGGELLVGQDFNVNPMSSVIAVRAADECHVLGCLEVMSSNTEEVAEELARLYPPPRRVVILPDPSGKARKTSAPVGVTDFTILEDAGFEVRSEKAAPPVVDRVNNAEAMFKKGNRRRVRIHPRAEALITCLNFLQYKEGTSIIDKTQGFDHLPDALGYMLWTEFNVLMQGPSVAIGRQRIEL